MRPMSDPPRADGDRFDLWLELLLRLTREAPGWGVWKNVDSALSGTGDLDTSAPPRDWDVIEREFVAWAAAHDLGGVAVCRCVPRTVNLVAVPEDEPTFLQLEVKGHVTFRASTLFDADDLIPLMTMDPRGFRILREGAQGLFKFLTNGLRRGGRPHTEWIASKQILELLRADPEGVTEAARLLGRGRGAALAGVDAALAGGWDRPAMLRLEALGLAKALIEPRTLFERTWFRLRAKRSCPVLRVVYQKHRLTPPDPQAWIREVAATHPTYNHAGRKGTVAN
jgi:hypothetical protein